MDLKKPWEKPGFRWDSGVSAVDANGRGEVVDSATSAVPEVTGTAPDTASTVVDVAMDKSGELPTPDSGTVDGPTDTNSPSPDASMDGLPRPVDTLDDAPKPDAIPAPQDTARPEDLAVDRIAPLPDTRQPDVIPDGSADTYDVGGGTTLTQGLLAYYPCESASGALLPDLSGNKKDATLVNGAGGTIPAAFTFATGKIGNGMALVATNKAQVTLPKGIVAKLTEMTVATWVWMNAGTAFQRIFDFGVDDKTFMYLTNADSEKKVRFRIANASGTSQVVQGGSPLPIGAWTHVAVTVGNDGIAIFINGNRVALLAPALLRPADLGETVNNRLGRSPFPDDPYLDGKLDEFRLYDRILTPAEIQALALTSH